ncbi:unnamed protein product [Discosporangium mesarthrocarpum]
MSPFFLSVDLLSRHVSSLGSTASEMFAEGCAIDVTHDYIPRWGYPHTSLTDRGAEFTVQVTRAAHSMLGIDKTILLLVHPATDDLVEYTNHTYAQMLSFVTGDEQDTWDCWISHVTSAHNISVRQRRILPQ